MKLSSKFQTESVTLDDRIIVLSELTGAERDRYEMSMLTFVDGVPTVSRDNVKSSLIHISAKNGDGEPAFASVEAVAALPARTVNAMFDICCRLSGLDEDAEKRAGEG